MRPLNPDETKLWARVTATIRPLSRQKPGNSEAPKAKEPTSKAQPPPVPNRVSRVSATAHPKPGSTLDSTWDRKLRTGALEPDRVVDLHGMNLDTAWRAIDLALERAMNRGERVILLITGHHRQGEPPIERGKIRAAVHDWLAASRHAPGIAAVRGASRRHGAGGSLYLILRRGR